MAKVEGGEEGNHCFMLVPNYTKHQALYLLVLSLCTSHYPCELSIIAFIPTLSQSKRSLREMASGLPVSKWWKWDYPLVLWNANIAPLMKLRYKRSFHVLSWHRIISPGRDASSQAVCHQVCVEEFWSSPTQRTFLTTLVYLLQTRGNQLGLLNGPGSFQRTRFTFHFNLLAVMKEGWAGQLGDAGSHSSLYHLLVGLTGSQVLSSGLIQWTASSLPTSPKMHPTAAWLYYSQRDFISIISPQLQTPFSEN